MPTTAKPPALTYAQIMVQMGQALTEARTARVLDNAEQYTYWHARLNALIDARNRLTQPGGTL